MATEFMVRLHSMKWKKRYAMWSSFNCWHKANNGSIVVTKIAICNWKWELNVLWKWNFSNKSKVGRVKYVFHSQLVCEIHWKVREKWMPLEITRFMCTHQIFILSLSRQMWFIFTHTHSHTQKHKDRRIYFFLCTVYYCVTWPLFLFTNK